MISSRDHRRGPAGVRSLAPVSSRRLHAMAEVRFTRLLGSCLVLACAVLVGCTRRPPQAAPPESLSIPVSRPVVREITEYVDFTGRTEAVQSVDVRPRTTGYLVEMPFKEGSEVKKNDLLFVIDPAAVPGAVRPGEGARQPLRRPAQAGPDDLRPRPGDQQDHPGGHQPAAARPGRGRGRGGPGPGERLREEPRGLSPEPGVHQGRLADRRHGQPLLPDGRQPGEPGPDLADHGRLARSDVRLFRRG